VIISKVTIKRQDASIPAQNDIFLFVNPALIIGKRISIDFQQANSIKKLIAKTLID